MTIRNEKRAAATFKAMSKRDKMKFVDTVQAITAKHYDYTDAEVEDALQDYDIDISKAARKKWEQVEMEQEATDMHSYMNAISLDRTVNIWKEAAVKKEMNDRELFIFDGFAGADKRYQLPLRVVTMKSWQGHFSHNMFIRPTEKELENNVCSRHTTKI